MSFSVLVIKTMFNKFSTLLYISHKYVSSPDPLVSDGIVFLVLRKPLSFIYSFNTSFPEIILCASCCSRCWDIEVKPNQTKYNLEVFALGRKQGKKGTQGCTLRRQ